MQQLNTLDRIVPSKVRQYALELRQPRAPCLVLFRKLRSDSFWYDVNSIALSATAQWFSIRSESLSSLSIRPCYHSVTAYSMLMHQTAPWPEHCRELERGCAAARVGLANEIRSCFQVHLIVCVFVSTCWTQCNERSSLAASSGATPAPLSLSRHCKLGKGEWYYYNFDRVNQKYRNSVA